MNDVTTAIRDRIKKEFDEMFFQDLMGRTDDMDMTVGYVKNLRFIVHKHLNMLHRDMQAKFDELQKAAKL